MAQTAPARPRLRPPRSRRALTPSLGEVRVLGEVQGPRATTIPIYRDLMADLETPASAFLKVRPERPAFPLESIEGGERLARYSFIGAAPLATLTLRDGIARLDHASSMQEEPYQDPLDALARLLAPYRSPD